MALTLTVSDNHNGTASATVTGVGAADTVTLYYQQVTGRVGAQQPIWSVAGTRTGNGTITVTVAKGHYWWYAATTTLDLTSILSQGGFLLLENNAPVLLEGSSGAIPFDISAPVYQRVTDGVAAVHDQICDAVVARITLLALDGIEQVERHKIPSRQRLTLPCCLVTSFNKAETMLGGTNERDDLGYPAYVLFVSRMPEDLADEGRVMLWRQEVSRAFRSQRLPGVAEVLTCEIEPDPVFEWDEKAYEYQFSAMTLRFHTREVRGFGA
jgi:hypothetical protein